jgi:threonine/homoserine/homoserine lactone efflux protein
MIDDAVIEALTALPAFVAVSLVVICTPGQDTALTVRNTLMGGRRAGVLTGLGVATGQACWTVAASAGVTAILIASEPAFVALKVAGAAYLIFLGGQALVSAIRRTPTRHGEARPDRSRRGASGFRQGVLSNLANPKMAMFFTSLLPQFAPEHGAAVLPLLFLGLVFCGLTFLWLAGYAAAVARAGDLLRRDRVRRWLDAVMGTALVGLGVRLATTSR